METLYQGFEDSKYRPSPLLEQMVDAGYLGRKSGRGFYKYEQAYRPDGRAPCGSLPAPRRGRVCVRLTSGGHVR